MDKYFELRTNDEMYVGVIYNIPENTSDEIIKNRIEVDSEIDELILTNKDYGIDVDISIDWTSIDFEEALDQDFLDVSECIQNSDGMEVEIVYTALKYMKENSNLSISEVIIKAFNECN
ncbi:hypothetical protein M0Q97_10330 [Candidatus Dojkabacteria bacterium]|jgi:hypothetical protein|nr:hypothetical protein [Candidatus Dojkabacteria bacterium]